MGDRSKEANSFIGMRIRQLRENEGLTQEELGKIVMKGGSTVRMWELGKSEPDIQTLVMIANHFNVTTDYLTGRKEATLEANDIEKSFFSPALSIPSAYSDVYVAMNNGDDDLTQDDVDAIVRFIEFTKNNKK